MHNIKQHIIFRLFAILIVALLFTPTAVKFAHTFEHHEHVVCIGHDSTHIHQVDLDCEFQKFQINNTFTISEFIFEAFLHEEILKRITSQYHFLSKFQSLHFSLRGPPSIV